MAYGFFHTAESVTPKHPDKMCDRISDAIVDACIEQDINSRVAIETLGGHGEIVIIGEITTNADISFTDIVRKIVDRPMKVTTHIERQSTDIKQGVDIGGAGDQGIVVGYACKGNPEMMPQEYYLARSLCKYIYATYPEDGKTQVTIDHNYHYLLPEDYTIKTIVASFNNVRSADLKTKVYEWLHTLAPDKSFSGDIYVNPAGDWSIGSFDADTGLTGRKIVVDAYGPRVEVGGGAFSGKDPTKVDRSGAYYARRLAIKHLQHNKDNEHISWITIKMAFAIGVVKPLMITRLIEVNGKINSERFTTDLQIIYPDLTVAQMIQELNLRRPIYEETARWGHFGNNFEWDKV